MFTPAAPDLTALAAELRQRFPDLGVIEPLTLLGDGFGSSVVETPDQVVLRVAKHAQSGASYAHNATFLPRFAAIAPVPVPLPVCYAAQGACFPYGVIGYRKLAGTPVSFSELHMRSATLEPLAEDVARFLLALHTFPLDQADELPLRDSERVRAENQQLADEVLPALREVLPLERYLPIARWWDRFLSNPGMFDFTPRVIHGDLWFENLLIANDRLAGVLDFEHASRSDPAMDFSTLGMLGEAFVSAVLNAYVRLGGGVDDGLRARAQQVSKARRFQGVQYGARQQNRDIIQMAVLFLPEDWTI